VAAAHVAGLVARCFDSNACAGDGTTQVVDKLRRDAARRPSGSGFAGDTSRPASDRYYGNLAWISGY
jgi:hypothetical protein